jgi:hypothetical protein
MIGVSRFRGSDVFSKGENRVGVPRSHLGKSIGPPRPAAVEPNLPRSGKSRLIVPLVFLLYSKRDGENTVKEILALPALSSA